jgi:hypothetical protein
MVSEENLARPPARALVRGASGALVVLVTALGAMTYRAVREGNEALRESDRAFHRGNLADAVLHARRAATAYAPGAPHTRAARERLRAVAVGSEAAGDLDTAYLAWGALRSAALETRHVTVPYAEELREATERLRVLQLKERSAPDEKRRSESAQKLERDYAGIPGPAAWASALLAVGFLLAIGGLVLVAVRGLTREGRVVWQRLAPGLGAFGVGALLWAIAVYFA